MKFVPNLYLRLVKRVSRPDLGVLKYVLTDQGLDDPNCTIVPVMRKRIFSTIHTVNYLEYYLEFEGKVYKAEQELYLCLHVPFGAQPVEVLDELPAA